MKNHGRKMQEPGGWASKEWPSKEVTSEGLSRLQADELQKLIH
jgi:hypothetical protein